jgi:hypothetical protein
MWLWLGGGYSFMRLGERYRDVMNETGFTLHLKKKKKKTIRVRITPQSVVLTQNILYQCICMQLHVRLFFYSMQIITQGSTYNIMTLF